MLHVVVFKNHIDNLFLIILQGYIFMPAWIIPEVIPWTHPTPLLTHPPPGLLKFAVGKDPHLAGHDKTEQLHCGADPLLVGDHGNPLPGREMLPRPDDRCPIVSVSIEGLSLCKACHRSTESRSALTQNDSGRLFPYREEGGNATALHFRGIVVK